MSGIENHNPASWRPWLEIAKRFQSMSAATDLQVGWKFPKANAMRPVLYTSSSITPAVAQSSVDYNDITLVYSPLYALAADAAPFLSPMLNVGIWNSTWNVFAQQRTDSFAVLKNDNDVQRALIAVSQFNWDNRVPSESYVIVQAFEDALRELASDSDRPQLALESINEALHFLDGPVELQCPQIGFNTSGQTYLQWSQGTDSVAGVTVRPGGLSVWSIVKPQPDDHRHRLVAAGTSVTARLTGTLRIEAPWVIALEIRRQAA